MVTGENKISYKRPWGPICWNVDILSVSITVSVLVSNIWLDLNGHGHDFGQKIFFRI